LKLRPETPDPTVMSAPGTRLRVVSFLGDYCKDGWYDREQGLRFIKYDDRSVTREKATEVTFVYIRIMNRTE
jgi:hypothetical protein